MRKGEKEERKGKEARKQMTDEKRRCRGSKEKERRQTRKGNEERR